MARKVYFSFHFDRDSWRVAKVRNSNVIGTYAKTPFYDKADWEKIKARGDAAIKKWIDEQMKGTSVTVVLIGKETAKRRWVKYEIEQSVKLGKGLLGVHITGIADHNGKTDDALGVNPLPAGYSIYKWNKDSGPKNLGKWIEDAAPN